MTRSTPDGYMTEAPWRAGYNEYNNLDALQRRARKFEGIAALLCRHAQAMATIMDTYNEDEAFHALHKAMELLEDAQTEFIAAQNHLSDAMRRVDEGRQV